MRVAIYTRISLDTEGLGLGVARQEQDCQAVVKRRGWDVAYVACDNDVSAYKRRRRPEFERVLADLHTGQLDGLCVYDLDRLARRPADLERLIDIYDQRKLVFATVQSDIDLSSPDSRTMARIMVAFASKSSMDTSRRVRRKHLELSQKGIPAGGNRPFGYTADKRSLEPKEAALLQQAAKDILSGVGLHTICRQWNEAGVKTTKGNPWQKSVLRNTLLSPRLAGYRVYQGGIARDDAGNPVTGLFPAILDIPTWEAICALITDPSRTSPHTHPGGRKYLLSGIMRCGACGNQLRGSAHGKYFYYVCSAPTSGGCGKVGGSGLALDKQIEKLVTRYLAEREVERPVETWDGKDELEAVTTRIYELMQQYGNGTLSGEVVFPTVQKLEDQAAKLKAERADWLRRHSAPTPTNVVHAWGDMDTDQKRSIIRSVLAAVILTPATKRGNRFDPERVELVWH